LLNKLNANGKISSQEQGKLAVLPSSDNALSEADAFLGLSAAH
jgi:hypothetical protein